MPSFTAVPLLEHRAGAPPPPPRTTLFHWRGQVTKDPKYSLGIRQQAVALLGGRAHEGIVVEAGHSNAYHREVLASKFCGVFPGNGWGHIELPILLGCIPVVVQDNIVAPWEDVLDFSSFALRLNRSQLAELPQILRDIPATKVAAMQASLGRVWERFTYSSLAIAERRRRCGTEHWDGCAPRLKRDRWVASAAITGRDAVDTLMHVLKLRLAERIRSEGGDVRS